MLLSITRSFPERKGHPCDLLLREAILEYSGVSWGSGSDDSQLPYRAMVGSQAVVVHSAGILLLLFYAQSWLCALMYAGGTALWVSARGMRLRSRAVADRTLACLEPAVFVPSFR